MCAKLAKIQAFKIAKAKVKSKFPVQHAEHAVPLAVVALDSPLVVARPLVVPIARCFLVPVALPFVSFEDNSWRNTGP